MANEDYQLPYGDIRLSSRSPIPAGNAHFKTNFN